MLLVSAITTIVQLNNVGENGLSRRKLSILDQSYTPTYVKPLLDELRSREKMFEDTPKNEIKYWFEYAGPLQKYYYRYSKSRGKADYFEGRDDSGVTSARFVDKPGAGSDFQTFFDTTNFSEEEVPYRSRLSHNCLTMGSPTRPKAGLGSFWFDWFGGSEEEDATMDRCRILFVMNTVGAGKGATMLWETHPPISNMSGPKPWMSEQETAATHLERNLKEIDTMCATGQVAARVQVLVCEPIPGKWTDWMDSMLINCGGKVAPTDEVSTTEKNIYDGGIEVEDRPSPVQVVVVASADTADKCHDLKSGFMEQRMKDLVLAPPISEAKSSEKQNFDPSVKTTHPDLISSDDHDLYVAFKWSSLVTIRTVSAFLQSSADIAAAAATADNLFKSSTKQSKSSPTQPRSAFLIPSFVRVAYVSEENNKVAKWRMHGDFFHPAAWEVSKESYEMTWIPHSLSSNDVKGVCESKSATSTGEKTRKRVEEDECGQWWIFMKEEQMPTTPEIFANMVTPAVVRGGSNFIWMLTESHRKQIVTSLACRMSGTTDCGDDPHAVIPLGDLESHLVNFMPNTSLGKRHEHGRRPGYSILSKLEKEREKVRERKQLKGQDDIEKALFDYTIYPAALFHKDATIMATRSRDAALLDGQKSGSGPQIVMSDYYDVTITKPRAPLPSWCQNISRRGLCSLHADYFRESSDERCWEACGMKRNWKPISS